MQQGSVTVLYQAYFCFWGKLFWEKKKIYFVYTNILFLHSFRILRGKIEFLWCCVWIQRRYTHRKVEKGRRNSVPFLHLKVVIWSWLPTWQVRLQFCKAAALLLMAFTSFKGVHGQVVYSTCFSSSMTPRHGDGVLAAEWAKSDKENEEQERVTKYGLRSLLRGSSTHYVILVCDKVDNREILMCPTFHSFLFIGIHFTSSKNEDRSYVIFIWSQSRMWCHLYLIRWWSRGHDNCVSVWW